MELDLEGVAAFATLAEEMHFGRAAARLHVGPPALTKRIQRLESQLHVSLVERGGGGVERLTAAGEQFLARAISVLAQARELQRSTRAGPNQILTIGVTCSVGASPTYQQMIDVATSYARLQCEVAVQFRGVPVDAVQSYLSSGEVDLAWGSFGPAQSHSIKLTPLGKFGRVAILTTKAPKGWSIPASAVQDFLFLTPFREALRWLSPYRIGAPGVEMSPSDLEIFVPRSADRVDRAARLEKGTEVIYSRLKSVRDTISDAVILRGDTISECYIARRADDRRSVVMGLLEQVEAVSGTHVLAGRGRGTYPALQEQERLHARVSDGFRPEAQPFDSVPDAGAIGRPVMLLDHLQRSSS
jgi:DNA-binding transcriptional LysR family regulator